MEYNYSITHGYDNDDFFTHKCNYKQSTHSPYIKHHHFQ